MGFSRGLTNSPPDCLCRLSPSPFSNPSRINTMPTQKRTRKCVLFCVGGAGGIRTHGTVAGTPDFESYTRLAGLPLFLVVSGRIVHWKMPKNKGFFRQTSPNSLLYRYFCENADFEAILARLQEIGKKTARRKSVVYTRFVRCRVSCRQENGKKSKICRWIRSHGKEPKNAEKN